MCLQFLNLCPVANEVWYLSSEIIVTYPPKIVSNKSYNLNLLLYLYIENFTRCIYTHISGKLVSFPSPTGSGPENSFEARTLGIQKWRGKYGSNL